MVKWLNGHFYQLLVNTASSFYQGQLAEETLRVALSHYLLAIFMSFTPESKLAKKFKIIEDQYDL